MLNCTDNKNLSTRNSDTRKRGNFCALFTKRFMSSCGPFEMREKLLLQFGRISLVTLFMRIYRLWVACHRYDIPIDKLNRRAIFRKDDAAVTVKRIDERRAMKHTQEGTWGGDKWKNIWRLCTFSHAHTSLSLADCGSTTTTTTK